MKHKSLIIALGFLIVSLPAEEKAVPLIVEKLTEIVKIYEGQVVREKLLAVEHRQTNSDLGKIMLALCEAKIDLARETGDRAVIAQQLKEILKIYQMQQKEAQILFELGRVDSTEISIIRARILETEVRILRLPKSP